jgi:hypothetical protein
MIVLFSERIIICFGRMGLLIALILALAIVACSASDTALSPVTNVAIRHLNRPTPALQVSFDAENQFVCH